MRLFFRKEPVNAFQVLSLIRPSKSLSIGTMTEESFNLDKPKSISKTTVSTATSTSLTDINNVVRENLEIISTPSTAENSLNLSYPGTHGTFNLENFFNYWLTSSSDPSSTKPDSNENDKFLKNSIIRMLMDSMAELKSEYSFNRIEPKSSSRSKASWAPNLIEYQSSENRVG